MKLHTQKNKIIVINSTIIGFKKITII